MNQIIIFNIILLIISVSSISGQKSQCQCIGPFEKWGTCISGTRACQGLCQFKGYTGPCTADCRIVCVCQSGYLRRSLNGECIPKDYCFKNETQCKCDNEFWNKCGPKANQYQCQRLCDNLEYLSNDANCSTECGPPICDCEDGFLRDGTNGECVPVEKCPCRGYEHIGCESSTFKCHLLCENKPFVYPTVTVACTRDCRIKCICDDGYLRDSTGVCITADECP